VRKGKTVYVSEEGKNSICVGGPRERERERGREREEKREGEGERERERGRARQQRIRMCAGMEPLTTLTGSEEGGRSTAP
jgi:hypothetical protein